MELRAYLHAWLSDEWEGSIVLVFRFLGRFVVLERFSRSVVVEGNTSRCRRRLCEAPDCLARGCDVDRKGGNKITTKINIYEVQQWEEDNEHIAGYAYACTKKHKTVAKPTVGRCGENYAPPTGTPLDTSSEAPGS